MIILALVIMTKSTIEKKFLATVKEAFNDCNTAAEYSIPLGYTSKLQVMDVGINKPFKDYLCCELEAWMLRNPNEILDKTTICGMVD
jgi:hypothetical protein